MEDGDGPIGLQVYEGVESMTGPQRIGEAIEAVTVTCLDCRHCEAWPKILDSWEVQCCKGHWFFCPRDATKEWLKRFLYTARQCKDYENGR